MIPSKTQTFLESAAPLEKAETAVLHKWHPKRLKASSSAPTPAVWKAKELAITSEKKTIGTCGQAGLRVGEYRRRWCENHNIYVIARINHREIFRKPSLAFAARIEDLQSDRFVSNRSVWGCSRPLITCLAVIQYSRWSTSTEKIEARPYCDWTIRILVKMFDGGIAGWQGHRAPERLQETKRRGN